MCKRMKLELFFMPSINFLSKWSIHPNLRAKLDVVPRWRRNKTGRPLSPPQIHQKIIWMLSNFHKTTSECWQRTPSTQKGSPFSSKGGRTKYNRQKERQESGTETHPGEGVVKEEKFPHTRKPCYQQVCGEFWNLRGQHNREEKKKNKNHRICA